MSHNLWDIDFLQSKKRDSYFRHLRKACPVSYHQDPHSEDGFWAVVRHSDIVAVTRDHETYISEPGTSIPDFPRDGSIINSDRPRHTALRSLIAPFFSPHAVRQLAAVVQQSADEAVTSLLGRETFDLVSQVSAKVPLTVLTVALGLPRSDVDYLRDLTDRISGMADPEVGGSVEGSLAASRELGAYGLQAVLDKPSSTSLMGQLRRALRIGLLTRDELPGFFALLIAAGNETTRTAISHGTLALLEHPQQRSVFQAGQSRVPSRAVEEICRWSTPIHYQRRTAVRAHRLNGQLVAPGEKVVLWYTGGNWDDSAIGNPAVFNLMRTPNPHLAFGARGGIHHCIGARLARHEIAVVLGTLFRDLPGLQLAGRPTFLRSNFLNGVKSLPATTSEA